MSIWVTSIKIQTFKWTTIILWKAIPKSEITDEHLDKLDRLIRVIDTNQRWEDIAIIRQWLAIVIVDIIVDCNYIRSSGRV